MGPLSILPIITPAFVLGLAMIYMFGRRGFVTHTLLGLSTNVFFGPLGVGVAQVLAFTPIAYLVLVGVIHSLGRLPGGGGPDAARGPLDPVPDHSLAPRCAPGWPTPSSW